MKYYVIDETAAKQACGMWSLKEYVEGSETEEYRKYVDNCYKKVEFLPKELKEKGEKIADKYARNLAEWYNKLFQIDMMCPSVMISGASNFPIKKKEKQNAARIKHFQLFEQIQSLPNKIDGLLKSDNIIKSSDLNALEQLRKKVEKAEALQFEMKATNAYYRKNKTLQGYKDYTEEQIKELQWMIDNYGVPFPSFELTNNNAKIKNAKSRIVQLERLKNEAKANAKQAKDEYKNDLFKVVENADIMRLQLFFDSKPDAEIRTILKKNGFKWSPSNTAWQRQLTDNAKYATKQIIAELKIKED